ncbi:hypothetical protein BN2537_8083 [Streptomyces venezuelae]|nr:hypothetical protein BN2537_8083 [Streptomyces venezuelae]
MAHDGRPTPPLRSGQPLSALFGRSGGHELPQDPRDGQPVSPDLPQQRRRGRLASRTLHHWPLLGNGGFHHVDLIDQTARGLQQHELSRLEFVVLNSPCPERQGPLSKPIRGRMAHLCRLTHDLLLWSP